MTATYEAIATTTLGSAQATVTFSGISGSFTDLVLIANTAISSGSTYYTFQLNSDTTNNYSTTVIRGNGTAADSARYGSTVFYTSMGNTINSTKLSNVLIANFMNYSNTTTFKTILTRDNNAGVEVDAAVSLWRSTSAITSITIGLGGNTFAADSRFTLYGIKAE